MGVNKVEIDGEVKLDLTQDTVTAAQLAQGVTAHDASGELITGTMTTPQLQIVVTTSVGATVTATKGSKTVSGTADASGNCTLTVDESGTWSVTATAGSSHKSAEVVVGTSNVELTMISGVFSENEWSTIIEACQSGEVPSTWAVGDQKTMTIGGHDYQIDIIGKNHDDYADGSGKAPLTFQLHDCYASEAQMNDSATTVGGWRQSVMRLVTLPAILAAMPTEVQNGIREVSKKANKGGNAAQQNETVADKLFLLGEVEIFGQKSISNGGDGTQYQYYKTESNRVKRRNGSTVWWWERLTRAGNGTTEFCAVLATGQPSYGTANWSASFSFAFCF